MHQTLLVDVITFTGPQQPANSSGLSPKKTAKKSSTMEPPVPGAVDCISVQCVCMCVCGCVRERRRKVRERLGGAERERGDHLCLVIEPHEYRSKTQHTQKLKRKHRFTHTTHLVSAPVLKGSSHETQDDRLGLEWYSLRHLLGL